MKNDNLFSDWLIKRQKDDAKRIVNMDKETKCLFRSKSGEQYLNEYWIYYNLNGSLKIGDMMGVSLIDLKYFLYGFSTGYISPGDYLAKSYEYRIFSDSQKWSWEYDKYKKNIKNWRV